MAFAPKPIPIRPLTIGDYEAWLYTVHGIDLPSLENWYTSVVEKVRHDFENSQFWHKLMEDLSDFDAEYSLTKGFSLRSNGPPKLVIKPFLSFVDKTLRKNILENNHFPNPPPGGWLLPNNWNSRINDLVRTFFVAKYLDGVGFLVEKIKSSCMPHSYHFDVAFEAREEGYYAAHINVRRLFEIPRYDVGTEKVEMSIEIQITTQLQEVIKALLHKFYEQNRMKTVTDEPKWKWDYESDEFAMNYLGHILHYIEGMIMDIRKRQGVKK